MPKNFAALMAAILFWATSGHAQSLVQDFEDFFDRCRASVETNSDFDHQGMTERSIQKRHIKDWSKSTIQKAWTRPGSDLYVVLTAWTSYEGPTRHLCDINLADEARILSEVEQAMLLRAFMMDRAQRLGALTHEIAKGLSPIPPIVNAGYLLAGRNPNGCKVINDIAFAPDGSFFSAGSGEQAIHPCTKE